MNIIKNDKGQIIGGTAERDEVPKGKIKIYDFYFGVDPDIIESGFAVWSKRTKKLNECTTLSFFKLYEDFQFYKNESIIEKHSFIVHIEGGWLVGKSNYHTDEKKGYHTIKESRKAQAIARKVGNNHQTGKLIVEMCVHLDISFVVRPPITPRFADQKYFKLVTGWKASTNADARSAANYVYGL